jgi:ABC-type lipoprotein release transport system permease subunit
VGAVWYRARSELRRRWLATAVLALLVAVAGAAVLAAAAGARRTSSAYPRLVEETAASDVLVNPNDGNTDFDAVEALPQVEDAVRGDGLFVVPRTPDGEPDFSVDYLPLASDGRLAYEVDRPARLEGRMPDPDVAEEVVLSRPLAEQLDLGVGDTLPALHFESEDTPPEPVELRVTGVGLFLQDALQTQENQQVFPTMGFGPAAARAWANPEQNFRASLVRLRGGDEERAAFLAAAPVAAGEQLFLQTQAETTAAAERALRPYAASLALFAAGAAVAATLVVGQALVRHLLASAADAPALAAVGVSRRQLAAGSVLQAAAVGVAGAVGAVGLAVVASRWMPVGPAREIEIEPGIDVDLLVLLGGGLAVVALALLAGIAVGVLVPRRALAAGDGRSTPSRLAEALAGAGVPPAAATGVRLALEGGRGQSSVPARTTLVGTAGGLAALVAALTFAASVGHLLDTPRLYGWDWDAHVRLDAAQDDPTVSSCTEPTCAEEGARAAALPSVAEWAAGSYGQVLVDGLAVSAMGVGAEGSPPAVHPSMVEGRPAAAPDEVVLGTTTLRRLDREVGDRVELTVADRSVEATVVGRTVFPRLAAYPGADKTGLGTGAAMTVEGLQRLIPGAHASYLLVRFAEGADRDAAVDELRAAFPDPPDVEDPVVEPRPQVPDDLAGYDRMAATPLVLAGLLAVLAGGTTAHALVLAVRRRRGELATLKSLGFTRRQVSSTVMWQSTTVAVVALLVGLPLGVAAGRGVWVLLAERLGAVAQPVTPVLAVALAVPVTLLVLNAVALVPGHRAGAVPAATALRAE